MKYFLLITNIYLFACLPIHSSEITVLEAFHIAEIYTSRAVDSWSMQAYRGDQHYVLEVPGSVTKQVWVDHKQGRVTKIEAIENGNSSLEYHWPGIKVVAHRGGVGLGVPENTLPAIQKAIEIGAQLIEIDIRETKDGHLVLMHDTTVDRTTNGTGRVDELSLEEIRKLDAGSWLDKQFKGTKVPTLEEALLLMKDKIDPDLDFKEGNVENLVEVVNKAGMANQCTYHTGTIERNKQITQLQPKIFIRPTIRSVVDIPFFVRELRAPLINMDWQAVSEESIRRTHIHGAKAFVNCLESADSLLYAEIAAKAGADYIQTDYPDKVIHLLQELGLMYNKKWDIGERRNPLANPLLRYPLR